jgi:hypothetical protein
MNAREITDDAQYRLWVSQHPDGFVLNTGSDPSANDATLHRASCMHIADHKTGQLAGSSARKFVAETKQAIREEATRLGRTGIVKWNKCGTCGA